VGKAARDAAPLRALSVAARPFEAVGRFFERRQPSTSMLLTLMAAYVVLAMALAVSISRGFFLLDAIALVVFAGLLVGLTAYEWSSGAIQRPTLGCCTGDTTANASQH